jgi:hypothetical protein
MAEIKFTMTSWLTKGLPRQFWLMKENKRCSILFHLLVPGGKWHTEMCKPVSSANFEWSYVAKTDPWYEAVFHARLPIFAHLVPTPTNDPYRWLAQKDFREP